ncbi:NUDIX hydrolase [Amycolatopsis japonica]|uniref:NUDIX hydrolase n=1 Tax=Amycolatopsis japonica TaxID=208439 RepID=UPI0033EA119B
MTRAVELNATSIAQIAGRLFTAISPYVKVFNSMKKLDCAPWKTRATSEVFSTPWFDIEHKDMVTTRGVSAQYFIHNAPDSVLVVCFRDGEILIEHQYRPAVQRISIDYPAGRVESTDKSPAAAALRELKEETGLLARNIKQLAVLDKDPSFSSSQIHIFLASDFQLAKRELDDTEDLCFEWRSCDNIASLIGKGEMTCTFCVSATYLAFRELNLLL